MTVFHKEINMDVEIQVAAQFIMSFLTDKFSKEKEDSFLNQLRKLLTIKFEGHWYPENPAKGSAYRCVSIENHLDAVIIKAAKYSGIDVSALSAQLPKRLDLWIDPSEVSYRIGEHGSVIIIYKEGDDCVNSTSKYLAKVLNQLPTIKCKEPVSKSQYPHSSKFSVMKNGVSQQNGSSNMPQVAGSLNASNLQRRVENHLSPIAKTFISRTSGMHIPYLNNHSFPPAIHPLLNLEYLQKIHWPMFAAGNGYDPLAAQLIHNYLIMQELQRCETRRLALQTHYLKMQNLHRPKKIHSNPNKPGASHNSSNAGLKISA